MLRATSRLLLLAALALSSACEDEALTQITVVVRSDIEQLDRVTLEIDGFEPDAGAEAKLDGGVLPRTLGLRYRGGPLGPVTVTARGYVDDRDVVVQTTRTSFVEDQHVVLFMDLLMRCAPISCDHELLTCRQGKCASIDVNPKSLRKFSSGYSRDPVIEELDAGGATDQTPTLDGGGADAQGTLECDEGLGDCDGDGKDCETDLMSSQAHCGECGNDCDEIKGAGAICSNGACRITDCKEGFADCDGDGDNACEREVAKDGPCAYQQTITIDNTNGAALSKYQVRLAVGGANPTPPPAGGCGGVLVHDGHAYTICMNTTTHGNAEAMCHGAGMELARVDDSAENDFLETVIDGDSWLGGGSADGIDWAWLSGGGGQFSSNDVGSTCANGAACEYGSDGGLYSNWGFARPNLAGLCMVVRTDGTWSNENCTSQFHFVCERDVSDTSEDFWSHVAVDGSDLRFFDEDGSALPYWIEQFDWEAQQAQVWIRVPAIGAYGTQQITMQYGINGPAQSDIGATMLFGDDFPEGDDINKKKWDTDKASTFDTTPSGRLRDNSTGTLSTGRLVSKKTFDGPIVIEANYKAVDAPATGGAMALGIQTSPGSGAGLLIANNGSDWVFSDGAWTELPSVSPDGVFVRGAMHHSGAGAFVSARLEDQSLVLHGAHVANPAADRPIALGRRYDEPGGTDGQDLDIRWQWVLARTYASPAPAVELDNNEHGGP